MSLKVVSLLVLYFPDREIVRRVENTLAQCDFLIVYDNTTYENGSCFDYPYAEDERILYVSENKNMGIGEALSFARRYSIANDFDFLLTLDQDTDLPQDYVNNMLSLPYLKSEHAIFGPRFYDRNNNRYAKFPIKHGQLPIRKELKSKGEPEEAFCIITSGAFHRVSSLQDLGDFRSDFFIDYVDNEYCLRAWLKGYKVLVCPDVCIEHSLGNRTVTRGALKFSPTNYSPVRKYYITRNRLVVYRQYFLKFPVMIAYDFSALILDLFRVFFFEKEKKKKLKAYLNGISDFFKGRLGPFQG